jgi:hypothetical protein
LDLRFADNKTLGDAYGGGSPVTFTRASTGTYIGSDGLLRSAVTNFLLRSEAIATSPWFNSNVTLTNNTSDVLDPVGGSTATKVVSTGSSSAFGQPVTLTAAIYAGSIWLRSSTGNISAQLIVYLASAPFTNIGTANVTITTTWQRFSVITSAATAASYNIQLNNIGAGTVYAWGAQLEQASTVGEYIPTVAAINSAPRFDHNPTTGESLGLLAEEARTNLWQWSNSATDGQTWNNVGTHLTLTAGQTSPAGDSTAIRAADVNSATDGTFLQRTTVAPALTAGTLVSYSIFIKPISIPNTIGLVIYANGTTDAVTGTFAVSGTAITGTPTVTSQGTGSNGSASYVAYPNGWYRLTFSGIPSTVTMADCRVRVTLGSYTRSTGTARFDWYGGQFENNAFASSYFPNAGTLGGVTRAADVASITGSNFSSFYNQTEGTVFAEAISVATNTNVFSISDNSTNNRIQLETGSNTRRFRITSSGSARYDNSVSYTFGTQGKTAGAYLATSTNHATNGTLGSNSTASPLPVVDRIYIGSNAAGSLPNNGTIKRLTYWPIRLADTTLQQITQP